MKQEDYPDIYISADKLAIENQNKFFNCFKIKSAILICAAVTSPIMHLNPIIAIIFLVLIITSLILSICNFESKYEVNWYCNRALAELLKTLTWRYMMCAHPFSKKLESNLSEKKFSHEVSKILTKVALMNMETRTNSDMTNQIKQNVKNNRELCFDKKKNLYLIYRIEDQLSWYNKNFLIYKSYYKYNTFFSIICHAFAIVITTLYISFQIEWIIGSIGLLLVVTASLNGWVHIKKYNEFAETYSLTSHEIGNAIAIFNQIKTNEKLSEFVNETENIFSKEHTKWSKVNTFEIYR